MKSGTEIKLSSEVPEKATRRRFDADYKLRILEEADQCTSTGQIGELLRREGLYSSHLTVWRKQRQAGSMVALGPKKRGRKPNRRDPMAAKAERLEQELRAVQERLRQAEAIIEVQKKVSLLLGIVPSNPESEGSN